MNAAKVHERRAADRPPRTPQNKAALERDVVGSSCTWDAVELEQLKVVVVRNVDAHEMIPHEYFDLIPTLEGYAQCMHSHSSYF